MKTVRFNGKVDAAQYFAAIRNGNTVLDGGDVFVFSQKLSGDLVQIMIEDRSDDEKQEYGPWLCYILGPVDLISALFRIVPEQLPLAAVWSKYIPWYIEGMTDAEESQDITVEYSMTREKAAELFGSNWNLI